MQVLGALSLAFNYRMGKLSIELYGRTHFN